MKTGLWRNRAARLMGAALGLTILGSIAACADDDEAAIAPAVLAAADPESAPSTQVAGVVTAAMVEPVGTLKVTFINGNTGFVLQTPGGRTYVIDPGLQSTYTGKLKPYLQSQGITAIDGLLITHPHNDHYDGARFKDSTGAYRGLIEDFQVKELYDSVGYGNSDAHWYTVKVADPAVAKGVKRTSLLRDGALLAWDPALSVQVFNPPTGTYFSDKECHAWNGYDTMANWTNENSLIVKVTHGRVTYLFTGDIHKAGMAYLIDRLTSKTVTINGVAHHFPARPNPDALAAGDVQILTIPHHGHNRNVYSAFRDTLKARVTIAPNDSRVLAEINQSSADSITMTNNDVTWWKTAGNDLYWAYQEGTITVTSDGAAYTVTTSATRKSVTYPAPGGYRYAPSFAATGATYQDAPSSGTIQLATFSVAAWFKTSADYSGEGMIVNKNGFGDDRAGRNLNYGIWMNGLEQIGAGFEMADGANCFVATPRAYNDGQWHHAAATFDGSTLRLFVDGLLISSADVSGLPDMAGTLPVRVGANALTLNRFFRGEIDEVRVWNRTLTASEVTAQFASGSVNPAGQVAHLPN